MSTVCLSVCVSLFYVLLAASDDQSQSTTNSHRIQHPASVSVRTPAAIVGPASSSTPRPASGASKAVEWTFDAWDAHKTLDELRFGKLFKSKVRLCVNSAECSDFSGIISCRYVSIIVDHCMAIDRLTGTVARGPGALLTVCLSCSLSARVQPFTTIWWFSAVSGWNNETM